MHTGSMDTDNPKTLRDAAWIRVPWIPTVPPAPRVYSVGVLLSDVLRR